MRRLEDEYEHLKSRDFFLHFTYPTESERKRMRIVHRDMTSAERNLARHRTKDLGNLVADLESGRVHVEDLDDRLVKRLWEFLSSR